MSQSKLAISIESKIRRSFHELQYFNIDIFGSVQFFELCIEISSRIFFFFALTISVICSYSECNWGLFSMQSIARRLFSISRTRFVMPNTRKPNTINSKCISSSKNRKRPSQFKYRNVSFVLAQNCVENRLSLKFEHFQEAFTRLFTPQRQHTSKFIRNFLM